MMMSLVNLDTLKEIRQTKPHFLRPLVDAYAHTNGNVDTLAKLNKYASGQISPLSMLKSPDPKQMSLFAKATWSVVMNNVLSGLSAARAMVGNTYQLTLKPITQILGHGIWDTVGGTGFEGVKRTMYYNGALWETNIRALNADNPLRTLFMTTLQVALAKRLICLGSGLLSILKGEICP